MASFTLLSCCLLALFVLGAAGRDLQKLDVKRQASLSSDVVFRGARESRARGLVSSVGLGSEGIHPRDDDDDANEIPHFATYANPQGPFYGAAATLNVWELPSINASQSSFSAIWITNRRTDGKADAIVIGWRVSKKLYGDSRTRLFTGWTTDNFETTGCLDLRCRGYVQVHPSIKPGTYFPETSQFDGVQKNLALEVSKDPKTGNWLLFVGETKTLIGYWPKTLFSGLGDSATDVEIGGEVVYPSNEVGPPMGSGQFALQGWAKAAHISQIKIMHQTGQLDDPKRDEWLATEDKSDCYTMSDLKFLDGLGYFFFFGGPGGCLG